MSTKANDRRMSDGRLMRRIESYDRALWVLKATDLREQKRVLEEYRAALLTEAKARGLIRTTKGA